MDTERDMAINAAIENFTSKRGPLPCDAFIDAGDEAVILAGYCVCGWAFDLHGGEA